MKREIYLFAALFLAAVFCFILIFDQRQQEHNAKYRILQDEISQQQGKIEHLVTIAAQKERIIDSLEGLKPQVIVKWNTIIKTVQTFSQVQTAESITEYLNVHCGASDSVKLWTNEADTFALLNSTQSKCILSELYTGNMTAELLAVERQQNGELKGLVVVKDNIIHAQDTIILSQSGKITILQKERRNEKRKGTLKSIVVGAGTALLTWLVFR
jgi:hypothetical protein